MKLPHIIIILVLALIIFALAIPSSMNNQSLNMRTKQLACALILNNTSASKIWITTSKSFGDQISEEELEQNGAIAIDAHKSLRIARGRWFSIYTRAPVTNDVYNRHYTFIQRACKKGQEEFTITMDAIEQKTFNAKKLIAIDHESESPEDSSLLCPDGKNPVLDAIEQQWFCEEERDGQIYFVPVYSYIYQWVPNFIISQWYIDHPAYYNWYNEHPEFWQHLKKYQVPWQSTWYKNWYKTASEDEIKYVWDPNEVEDTVIEHQRFSDVPFGLTADQVSITKSP